MRPPVIPFRPPPAANGQGKAAASTALATAAHHLTRAREEVESAWQLEMSRPDEAERIRVRLELGAVSRAIEAAGRRLAAVAPQVTDAAPPARRQFRRKPR